MDHRQLQRIKNEALAAALLHHQRIVPVFAVGSDRGVHFYAMQLIEGQTLVIPNLPGDRGSLETLPRIARADFRRIAFLRNRTPKHRHPEQRPPKHRFAGDGHSPAALINRWIIGSL
jgi:hypothetical protein